MNLSKDYADRLNKLSWELADDSIRSGRVRFNTDKPFLWASGYYMPVYNDNRQILINPKTRMLVKDTFEIMIKHYGVDAEIIAGTSTAGISPATTLADSMQKPLIYIREKPKDHGLRNRIEGIAEDQELNKRKTLLIEDVISTAGSSASSVQAIRDANGVIEWCFAMFDYGFDIAKEVFQGLKPYNSKGDILKSPCNTAAIIYYDKIIGAALKNNALNMKQVGSLDEWRNEPFLWGDKRGFQSVTK